MYFLSHQNVVESVKDLYSKKTQVSSTRNKWRSVMITFPRAAAESGVGRW
jgi:hypothetical protein